MQRIEDDKKMWEMIKEQTGLSRVLSNEKKESIVAKYEIIENQNKVDHANSIHSDGIQRSKYLRARSDMKFLKK